MSLVRIVLDPRNHDMYELYVDGVRRDQLGALVWRHEGGYIVIDASTADVDNPHFHEPDR